MKILRKGRLARDRKVKGECIQCGTEIEITVGEGTIVHDQRDGDAVTFPCPTCGQKIWIALRGRDDQWNR